VDNIIEQQLIGALVTEKRSFQKQLRYNLPPDKPIATAVLTDCYNAPLAMYIDVDDLVGRWASTVAVNEVVKSNSVQTWMWVPREGMQPDLPPKKGMAQQPRKQVDEPLAAIEDASVAPPSDPVISEPPMVEAAPQVDEKRGTVTPIKDRPTLVPPSVAATCTAAWKVTSISDNRRPR